MMVWAPSAGGGGWKELEESGSGLGVQEWGWHGSAGGAQRGWECRSGSGLVVLEVLKGRSLLEIYVHQHLCTS